MDRPSYTIGVGASAGGLEDIPEVKKAQVVACDDKFRMISWNRQSQLIFGYVELEVLGKDYFETLQPILWKEEKEKIKNAIIKSEHSTGHTPIQNKWNKFKNAYTIQDILFYKSGTIDKIIIVNRKL